MDSLLLVLEQTIQTVETDTILTFQEELDLKRNKLCLDKALTAYVDSLLTNGDCDKAFSLYNRQSDDVLRLKAYSVLMECNRCQEAGNWISHFTTQNTELQDYINVQFINVTRLCDPRIFEPTEEELYNLYELTQETHPYGAYARSLWHILTGESIFLPIPEIQESVNQRSTSTSASDWALFPNPTSGDLTISFDRQIESGEIMITDSFGRCITDMSIFKQQEQRIDVSSYDEGIYYVRVRTGDKLIYIDKFIVN